MFKEWCAAQGFSTSTNLSHVLMDGGVLSIPFDRLNEFYKVYVECVKGGERVFVVEQKTEIYNFFLDIDYKDDEAMSLEKIEQVSKIICEKVNSLGGGNCLVSISKPKPHGTQIKSGIHINWPNFPVDQKNAVYLRKHIVNTLTKLYPTEVWEKIVDDSVYGNPDKGTKGSGFRMPWSHKRGKHIDCGGNGCLVCENTGKLTEVCYLPVFMYCCEGPFKIMKVIDHSDPSVETLLAATIRTQCKTSRVVEPPDNLPKKKKEGSFTRDQTKNSIEDPEIATILEKFINGMKGHEKVRINKIFKSDKSDAYFIGTDSSYCENAGKDHSSNHVWFLAQEKDMRIAQKCFCRCEVLRKRGFCKDFTGQGYELNPTLKDKLFPNKKSAKIKSAIAPNVSVYSGVPSLLDRILLSKTR
jgi:hypothetical protein